MSRLTLIFPIALIIFIGLVFADYLPLLRKKSPCLYPQEKPSLNGRDSIFILFLSVAYAITAFTNLGSNSAPQSFFKFEKQGDYALIELAKPTDIGTIVYYTGLCTGEYYLQFSSDGENWTDQLGMSQSYAKLFKWLNAELGEGTRGVKYIRIISGGRLWLGELAIFDSMGNMLENKKPKKIFLEPCWIESSKL